MANLFKKMYGTTETEFKINTVSVNDDSGTAKYKNDGGSLIALHGKNVLGTLVLDDSSISSGKYIKYNGSGLEYTYIPNSHIHIEEIAVGDTTIEISLTMFESKYIEYSCWDSDDAVIKPTTVTVTADVVSFTFASAFTGNIVLVGITHGTSVASETISKTADYTLLDTDVVGSTFSNVGAVKPITLTLPAATPGMIVTFINNENSYPMYIAAANGETIDRLNVYTLISKGTMVSIKCVTTGIWIAEYEQCKQRIIATGGRNAATDSVQYTVLMLINDKAQLLPTLNNLPAKRDLGSMFVINDAIYYCGGLDATVGTVYADDTFKFNPNTSEWSSTSHLMPSNVYQHRTFVLNGYAYSVGGNNGTTRIGSTFKYDPASGWTTVGSLPNTRTLQGGHAFVSNGYAYFVGGLDATVSKEAFKFDPSTETWTQLDSSKELAYVVASGSIFTLNGYTYIVGGYSSATVKTMQRFDPITEQWAVMSSEHDMVDVIISAWGERVVYNNKAYLFCGTVGGVNYTNKTYEFDPVSETWVLNSKIVYPYELRDGSLETIGDV